MPNTTELNQLYGSQGWTQAGQSGQSIPTGAMPTQINNKDYGQNMRAYIARDQWNDYQNRFAPYEDKLIDSVTSTQMLDERLGAISANAARASTSSMVNQQQLMGRYGIQHNAVERQVNSTNNSLAQSSAVATSKNSTRQHVEDRNMAVMGGGEIRQQAATSYTGQ